MRRTLKFQPGFRLSEMDVGIIMLGVCVSVLLARLDERLGMMVLFVLAHFFLFCNVLRMSRPLELIWAGLFVLLARRIIGDRPRFLWNQGVRALVRFNNNY